MGVIVCVGVAVVFSKVALGSRVVGVGVLNVSGLSVVVTAVLQAVIWDAAKKKMISL